MSDTQINPLQELSRTSAHEFSPLVELGLNLRDVPSAASAAQNNC